MDMEMTGEAMSKSGFHLVYDIDESEIDAKQLSSALLSMSELLEEADKVINGGKTKTRVNVKGSFKTGSFQVDFSSFQSITKVLQDTLLSDGSQSLLAASGLIGILFTGKKSLWRLLKWLQGSKPTKIISTDDGKFRVYKGDEFIETERKVIELYENYKVRQAFEDIVTKQLVHDPVKGVAIIDSEKEVVDASKEESSYFVCMTLEQSLLEENVRETNINLINVSFKEGNKWRVTDGGNTFYAIVEDKK
ncbi:MAG: hypothetical protein P9L94_10695 [Candidatus Hinthialibacter antarcticus]|nr:hypothetical protein [Candidatus Hinthialibacter antarcticus]